MCEMELPQKDSHKMLAVGHKMRYQGREVVIARIRVVHDLGTLLDPPHRAEPLFDLQGNGFYFAGIRITDPALKLWWETPTLPMKEVAHDKGPERSVERGTGPAQE